MNPIITQAQKEASWKKFTLALGAILLMTAQVALGAVSAHNAALAIAVTIVGLVVTGIVAAVFIFTQGKIDLTKVQINNTPIDLTQAPVTQALEKIAAEQLAKMLEPQLAKVPLLPVNLRSMADAALGNPTLPPAPLLQDAGSGAISMAPPGLPGGQDPPTNQEAMLNSLSPTITTP